MRLTDRIELFEQGEPGWDENNEPIPGQLVSLGMKRANVSYQVVERTSNAGHANGVVLIEEIRAIIEPMVFDPAKHQVKWNGVMYTNDGPPMARRRNGRTHHLTLALKIAANV